MKNVKKLLIFAAISTFVFASSTRTDALGGAGYWADDYSNIGAFPASVNDHNVAWTNGSNFTSIFDKDGTTWGFAAGGMDSDDVANVMWGNGSMGASLGIEMIEETSDGAGDGETNLAIGFGMPLSGMDFGFTYDTGNSTMGVNLRRAQSIWVWDNMLINFSNTSDDTDTNDDESAMDLDVGMYSNTTYDNGTSALFGLAFNYGSAGDDNMMGITWNFGVESAMTDWATLRVGYSHAYDFQDGGQSESCSDTGETSGTNCDEAGGLTLGLGFNYGSFNLDMALSSGAMFNDPVKYVTGRNDSALGAGWTISYAW
jgi:hypothetical protein